MFPIRARQDILEAIEWPHIEPYEDGKSRIVNYYRHPDVPGENLCTRCDNTMDEHGFIDTGENGRVVCPGDYLVEIQGEYYPIHKDTFWAIWEDE